jgi:hypothetical protein
LTREDGVPNIAGACGDVTSVEDLKYTSLPNSKSFFFNLFLSKINFKLFFLF